jgi:hypothetical protein
MSLKLKPQVKQRWLQALRSGKIKQARGKLRREDDSMCCLGVLCNLHAESHPKIAAKQTEKTSYMGNSDLPSVEVLKWAFKNWNSGFDDEAVFIHSTAGGFGYSGTLAEKNDNGASFKQIANIIEKHL